MCFRPKDQSRRADFEYGRLLACQGDKDGALKHFEYVTAGKAPESNPAGWRGKYNLEVGSSTHLYSTVLTFSSVQSALNLKTHAAVEALALGRRL